MACVQGLPSVSLSLVCRIIFFLLLFYVLQVYVASVTAALMTASISFISYFPARIITAAIGAIDLHYEYLSFYCACNNYHCF